MYLLNISFVVQAPVNERWLGIIKSKYLPFISQEGYRVVAFSRVLSDIPAGEFTYSLLADIPDMAAYRCFIEDVLGDYASVAGPLFGDSVLWLATLMKKLDFENA